MKELTIYTDGSSLGNPGAGGYCAILLYKGIQKIIHGGEPNTTNNRMELTAVIQALKVLKEPCRIKLYTDSQYVSQGITEWLAGWIRKNFKEVKNPDLWRQYVSLKEKHSIQTIWIRGHNGDLMNEECDKMARTQAQRVLELSQFVEEPKTLFTM